MIKNNTTEISRELIDITRRCGSVIDAIVHYSEQNGMEIETLASIVKNTPTLKSMMETEARKKKLLVEDNTGSKLPL